MNKYKLIVLAIALLVMTLSLAAAPTSSRTETYKSKHKHLFVLKAEKKLVGATVEVFSSRGVMVTSETLDNTKLVIDFRGVRQGAYKIRITKGKKVKEYNYLNI